MNNIKGFIFAVIFIFFSTTSSQADNARSTTFDDRPACEKNNGVWREFGNSCVDECEHLFNDYKICPNAITFGCDCGEGRCMLDNKCISIADYKKSYDEKVKKEQEINKKKKEERDKRIKEDPQLRAYLYNIYNVQQNQPNTNPQNPQQPQAQAQPQQLPQIASQPKPQGQIVQNNPSIIPQTPQASPIARQVPPAFLEQEKKKQEQQKQQASTTPAGVTPLIQDPKTGEVIQLPVVPLPQ